MSHHDFQDDFEVNEDNLTIVGYEPCEEIGRGGMGVVYRARDLGFERDVAFKDLREKVAAVLWIHSGENQPE